VPEEPRLATEGTAGVLASTPRITDRSVTLVGSRRLVRRAA
jgi:hypothetical protein